MDKEATIQVFNQSGRLLYLGRHECLPDKWTAVSYQAAVSAAGNPDFTVTDPALARSRYCKFKDDEGLHLGWSSPLHYADGYGSIAQEIAATFLETLDVRLAVSPRDYDPGHPCFGGYPIDEWHEKAFVPQSVVDAVKRGREGCFYGFNMTWPPDVWRHRFCRGFGLTMFETSKPPDKWAEPMNRCHAIVVPCKQNKQAFEGIGVTVPIHVVNLGVDPEFWTMPKRDHRGKPFTFLMSAGITFRKNPHAAAEAFVNAFPGNKDVRLIFKTRGAQTAAGFREWAKSLPQDDRIQVVCEESTPEQMRQWMHDADAFVFPSRGEGFGLTPLQAMSTGLPVIVSDNSGMSEYCDTWYNFPIPCREVPVPKAAEGGYPEDWGDCGNWWEPDMDMLAGNMRFVHSHQGVAQAIGADAAVWVRQRWTVERTCQALLDVVMDDARDAGLV